MNQAGAYNPLMRSIISAFALALLLVGCTTIRYDYYPPSSAIRGVSALLSAQAFAKCARAMKSSARNMIKHSVNDAVNRCTALACVTPTARMKLSDATASLVSATKTPGAATKTIANALFNL